jgi:integrase
MLSDNTKKGFITMATYTVRGVSHNVVYSYKTESGKSKQQWETYSTELEARRRMIYIDLLQKEKQYDEIRKAVYDYRRMKAIEKSGQTEKAQTQTNPSSEDKPSEDNTYKTYREFADKWLPFHARKERISPNTYDSYAGHLKNHILPYFGDRVMSTITAEDIDDFVDWLSKTPCKGVKSHRKKPSEVSTLSSATVKKCYSILTSGFPTAKKWRYVTTIPETSAPAEKTKKRKAWNPEKVYSFLHEIEDDELLHLAAHIAFVCSLRAGEVVGIAVKTIDFQDRSLWIKQEVQRVSDKALEELPGNEIIRVFPKQVSSAKSSLILKGPKTEGSHRKLFLTFPLMREIQERLAQIKRNKEFFGKEYFDYGLLLCRHDGRPIEPKSLDAPFKRRQAHLAKDDQIEFQGLRKSGEMHKIRLSKNNFQLVAENGGHSPEVLMRNYNDVLESEKKTLAAMVEASFYQNTNNNVVSIQNGNGLEDVMQKIQENPALASQIMQLLLAGAVSSQQSIVLKN